MNLRGIWVWSSAWIVLPLLGMTAQAQAGELDAVLLSQWDSQYVSPDGCVVYATMKFNGDAGSYESFADEGKHHSVGGGVLTSLRTETRSDGAVLVVGHWRWNADPCRHGVVVWRVDGGDLRGVWAVKDYDGYRTWPWVAKRISPPVAVGVPALATDVSARPEVVATENAPIAASGDSPAIVQQAPQPLPAAPANPPNPLVSDRKPPVERIEPSPSDAGIALPQQPAEPGIRQPNGAPPPQALPENRNPAGAGAPLLSPAAPNPAAAPTTPADVPTEAPNVARPNPSDADITSFLKELGEVTPEVRR
jgi:hypothetical protein